MRFHNTKHRRGAFAGEAGVWGHFVAGASWGGCVLGDDDTQHKNHRLPKQRAKHAFAQVEPEARAARRPASPATAL